MSRHLVKVACALAVCIAVGVAFADLVNCASAELFPGYVADNAACAVLQPTRAAAESCVASVQSLYCGDGGIATYGDSGFCGVAIPDTGAAAFIAGEAGTK